MNRRKFLKDSAFGLVGVTAALNSVPVRANAIRPIKCRKPVTAKTSRAALIKGEERYSNVTKALALIKGGIKQGIGHKQVVIKPNFVVTNKQLAATHVDCITAILDMLKPIYDRPVILAESPAFDPASVGFANYGYHRLQEKYDVKFVELDEARPSRLFICDKNLQPLPIQVSSLLMDPDVYLISSAVMKTHDTVVATLSLKNVLMGAPLKIGGKTYKRDVHQGIKQINFNLFNMAMSLKPDLAVIDGFVGMEGNGPVSGTPVDTGVAIASTDFLSADRIAVEVMGIDFAKIGYLSYCARANLGVSDLSRIELLGEDVSDCRHTFRLHENIDKQYQWQETSGV